MAESGCGPRCKEVVDGLLATEREIASAANADADAAAVPDAADREDDAAAAAAADDGCWS